MRVDLALLAGAFVLGTVVAELAGARNLGTALTFGVMAFAAAVVWIIAKRPG
jgi:hypothetical protein